MLHFDCGLKRLINPLKFNQAETSFDISVIENTMRPLYESMSILYKVYLIC